MIYVHLISASPCESVFFLLFHFVEEDEHTEPRVCLSDVPDLSRLIDVFFLSAVKQIKQMPSQLPAVPGIPGDGLSVWRRYLEQCQNISKHWQLKTLHGVFKRENIASLCVKDIFVRTTIINSQTTNNNETSETRRFWLQTHWSHVVPEQIRLLRINRGPRGRSLSGVRPLFGSSEYKKETN